MRVKCGNEERERRKAKRIQTKIEKTRTDIWKLKTACPGGKVLQNGYIMHDVENWMKTLWWILEQ